MFWVLLVNDEWKQYATISNIFHKGWCKIRHISLSRTSEELWAAMLFFLGQQWDCMSQESWAEYMVIKWNLLLVFLVLKLMSIFLVWGNWQQTVSSFASCHTVRYWFCLNYRWERKYKGIQQAGNDHRISVTHNTTLFI